MKIMNHTPHAVVFVQEGNEDTIFESVGSIRIETKTVEKEPIGNFTTVSIEPDKEKTIVPEKKEGVFYIVSGMVREMFPERKDFISPCTDPKFVIRDEKGFVKGVKAFVRN